MRFQRGWGFSTGFFLRPKAHAIIVPNTTLVIKTSSFLIPACRQAWFSLDFLWNIDDKLGTRY